MGRRLGVRMAAVAAAAATLTALGGCSGWSDKTGGDTVALDFAVIDHVDRASPFAGPVAFIDALTKVSGGRLKVEVREQWGEGDPEAEADILAAVAEGELDGGFASVRAFPAAGFEEFAALQAPFVITSYAAQREIVQSDIVGELLDGLSGSGVVGLGVMVAGLRRPFGIDGPLLDLEDWAGDFRVYNSQTQADAVTALGASPIDLGYTWVDYARAGDLRGIEFDVNQYYSNGMTTEAGNLTSNAVLWPKMDVLTVSQSTWDGLTEQQRGWITEAAQRAVAASIASESGEAAQIGALCDNGLRLFELAPAQLASWRTAVEPVLEALAAAERTADVLSVVRSIAAKHPADDLDIPEGCRGAAAVSSAAPGEPLDTPAPIPDGVYRVDVTEAALAEAGESNGPGWSGSWTLTIAGGTYATTCAVIAAPGKDCGNVPSDLPAGTILDAGYLRGDESTVSFVYDAELHSSLSGCELPCQPLPTQMYTWSVTAEELTLGEVTGGHSAVNATIAPWLRLP